MNDDVAKGTVESAAGTVEEKIGTALGDEGLEAEGLKDRLKGEARKAYGRSCEFAKENQAIVVSAIGVVALVAVGALASLRRSK